MGKFPTGSILLFVIFLIFSAPAFPWCGGMSMPEPCPAPGASRDATGSHREPAPLSGGRSRGLRVKHGQARENPLHPSPRASSKAGCSAPKRDTPSQIFLAEAGGAVPSVSPGGRGVVTVAEVGADANLLVAIRRPAGAGVAVTEAAGAADGVVGLQVKPARLAPGHGEETGVCGTGQAGLPGSTAAPVWDTGDSSL